MKKQYWALFAVLAAIPAAYAAGVRIAPMRQAIDPAPFITTAKTYAPLIERDTFGVPHISGARDADVAFGFGYAHSEDDFATIADAILTTRGRAATYRLRQAIDGLQNRDFGI